MPYLIGTDEAGYGPNLGPLVISASVWEVPDGVRSEDLYQLLHGVISCGAGTPRARSGTGQASGDNGPAVVMADSKVLYQSGKGLQRLEQGLWAAFALLGRQPRAWSEVWELLAPGCGDQRRAALCEADDDHRLPMHADPEETGRTAAAVCRGVATSRVRLAALHSRVVFPAEFNEAVSRFGSKGTALSRWTLDLVGRMIESLPAGPVSVLCDKHGGRDRYLPLLMDSFPGAFVEVRAEGRRQSIYRFALNGRSSAEASVEICFQAKGEGLLPAALASMASKYLRELAMQALNAYWCSKVADLLPTAGYPNDALRFHTQIATIQKELGIEDHVLWRIK
jgi:hypothetical protein